MFGSFIFFLLSSLSCIQTSMSVIGMNSITVMKMHSVLTWMGVITVLATLGTVEMDTPVQVSSIH